MTRVLVASGLGLWLGATLLLSAVRPLARPRLSQRLAPYAPGGVARARGGILSTESFRDVIAPLSTLIGGRMARAFGISEELALRLERIHSEHDVVSFRVRQMGTMVAAFGVATLVAVGVGAPATVGIASAVAMPLFAFGVLEHKLARESAAWQRRIFLELPVVSEQLAMLLSAGYSLGAARTRIAARGQGACARDLARVGGRVRQGLSEIDALREWAAVARVPALDRLVPVLALNREASDLGRLLSEEARTIRRDVQRELIETMERRGQQVWIPVTVATLVPGVIFLAIPFIEALRLFAGS